MKSNRMNILERGCPKSKFVSLRTNLLLVYHGFTDLIFRDRIDVTF